MPPYHFNLETIIRPNILALQPYRCARDDYQSGILMDANENAYGHSIVNPTVNGSGAPSPKDEAALLEEHLAAPLHRYPDPSHPLVKSAYARLRGVSGPDRVFLGVGSDEVIDLLFRVTCVPGKDKILVCPPSYGMYPVCAQVNDVGVVKVPQETTGGRFSIQVGKVLEATAADPAIKMIFLTSPGNPTSTLVPLPVVKELLDSPSFKGLVVIDEAYIDFAISSSPNESVSAASVIDEYPNLVVLQTLSKGFGLAAIRLGLGFASPELVQILSNTKAPYNISAPTAALALRALAPESLVGMRSKIQQLIQGRQWLVTALEEFRQQGDLGNRVGGLDGNFVMFPVLKRGTGKPDNVRAEKVYKKMAETEGVVVRFRGREVGCGGCLRITIGTDEENRICVEKLRKVLEETD